MSQDRDSIFKSIKSALEPLQERTAYPNWEPSLAVSSPQDESKLGWVHFQERLKEAHGVFLEGWLQLKKFLQEQNYTCGYADHAFEGEAKTFLSDMEISSTFDRDKVDAYQFGITAARGVIAESGTIVLDDSTTDYRLGALAPWCHIALVKKEQLFPTINSAVAAFDNNPSIIFATGPSKTADIEGILIEGVHGPGIQVCCLI